METSLHKARYEALVASHGDLVSRFSPDGILSFVSRSYSAVLRVSEQDLVGSSIFDKIAPGESPSVRQRIAAITIGNPTVRGENDFNTAAGPRRFDWVETGIFDQCDRLVEIQSVGRDITELRRIESELLESHRRLEHIASHDPLTGLPNRFLFLDRLAQAIKAAERARSQIAVLFIDLDGFKQINDSLGHQCGDELLRQIAARISDSIRAADTVCRLGGDEFVVLLGGSGRSGAEFVGLKLRQVITAPFDLGATAASLDASIGTAVYPEDGTSGETLLNVADQSMYALKRTRATASAC